MTGDLRDMEPPPRLEDRVVSTLRARGLLGGPWRRLLRRGAWPAALAAGLLLFAGGFVLGRGAGAAGPAEGLQQYTLLLYDPPEFNPAGVAESELVSEYRGWAGDLAKRGRLVGGERLGESGWTLGGDPGGLPLGGYFVIAARDSAEALAIARTCPHIRYGGRISVRPIVPT
ncbi:MAG TPA: YciI family protein [Gemmatimonadales bacterium]|nr:YciI family protein [Gemmatimonadales bacterium]